jgi:uncharacterized protein
VANAIFVNMPVVDVARSRAFFTGLGFTINEMFSDETALCVVLGENLHAQLMTPDKFAGFTTKPTTDGSTAEVIVSLAVDSRADVDRICDTALASGASKAKEPQDLGFMYLRSFLDQDGHQWEFLAANPDASLEDY